MAYATISRRKQNMKLDINPSFCLPQVVFPAYGLRLNLMGKHFLSQKHPHEAIYSNRATQPYSPQHFSISARAVSCEVLKD